MPPKNIAALAQAVKDRVTKKTAADKKPAAKTPAAKKSASKKAATKKGAADDAAATAITADNKPPAAAPKRELRSAGKAPAPRANNKKKRKSMSDDGEDGDIDEPDDKENKAPPAKKPKKAKTPVPKTAAEKTAAGKATDAEPDVMNKAKASASKTSGKKHKAAEEDEDENDARPAKKAKVTKSKETVEKKKVAPKKVAPKKTAPKKATPEQVAPKKASNKKRKASEDEDDNDEEIDSDPAATKAKATEGKDTAAKKTAPKKAAAQNTAPKEAPNPALKIRIGVPINATPTDLLDIFVFGEGGAGELGLGSKSINGKLPLNVKRPRLNPFLSGKVVQYACGGMHGIALTKDNKVLTWGVNDNSALGRDTTWDGSYPDQADDADDESGLNPYESTPAEIDMANVAPGTKFVHVAACDSASFALTEDGRIYSWGTFRGTEGVLGFNKDVKEQKIPILLPEPRKIVSIATGANHVLTLDHKGKMQTWGAYQQNQLGRRIVDRDARASALRPGGLPIKLARGVQIASVSAGSYHSFARTTEGSVYAWGLNNFGQLGFLANDNNNTNTNNNNNQEEENADLMDGTTVLQPTLVTSLQPYHIVEVLGGEHHAVARTDKGQVLVWGRVDGHQCGLPQASYNAHNSFFDERGRPRIVRVPTAHDGTLPGPVVALAVGVDTSIAITGADGVAWSWGFNLSYQAGHGETDGGEVFPPRAIDNSVVQGRRMVSAGCGGQFSMLASRHGEE